MAHKQLWKQQLPLTGPVQIKGYIVKVGVQHNQPVGWFEVEDLSDEYNRRYHVYITGEEIPAHATYVDSFQLDDPFGVEMGYYVGHVYEVIK